MEKIVVLANREGKNIIEFWDDLGQSPSAINMAGNIYIGHTNEYSLEDKEKMQKDIDNGNYGNLRDWGIFKYNLL